MEQELKNQWVIMREIPKIDLRKSPTFVGFFVYRHLGMVVRKIG